MPTQVSLLDGALASAGTLAIQTNGTTNAITISSAQVATFVNNPIMTGLTASRAVFTDGSKGLTSNAITGTGNVVMSASPTLTGTVAGASLQLSSLTSGRVTYAGSSGLLQDSANLLYSGTDLTVYGITVGRGAGADSGTTVVGAGALAGSNTGANNTAIGKNVLAANTSGAQNNALGYAALTANTTGADNTAMGHTALYSNTTGGQNTAFGRDSLRSNTTASYNTAVGYQAAYASNVSSDSFGFQAHYQLTSGAGNAAFGLSAGYNITTGARNTSIGNSAGANSGTALTGSDNTALGYQALTLTSGAAASNTAIGSQALRNNTTASNNTAVGYQAGYSNATGTNLTALGNQAGRSSTANNNTLLGASAGYSTTSGNANTLIGSAAGYSNTTGAYNTAIGGPDTSGNFVFEQNTTGSYNTVLGAGSLAKNTTADANTAVGYQSLYSNTTGTLNTAIGRYSGYGNTTGSNNTFIGEYAGRFITTGGKNSILGRYDGNQGGLDIRTASNYIVLSDGDGNPRGFYNPSGYWDLQSRAVLSGANNGGTAELIWTRADVSYMWANQTNLRLYGQGTNTTNPNTKLLEIVPGSSLALEGASSQTGTGITFPATQSASSNANTLDDYEEGTWTPTFTTDGTAPTYTATSVQGAYTKIGNVVFVTFYIFSSGGATGGTGNVRISGLPFSASTSGGQSFNRILPNYLYWGGANKWSADGRNGLGWRAGSTVMDLYAASITYANGAFEVGGSGYYYV